MRSALTSRTIHLVAKGDTMLRFCGFGIELFVDAVLDRGSDEPHVCSASDATGQRWLIVAARNEPENLTWVCAPASARMVDQVSRGDTTASEAIQHSQTGWVEMVSIVAGRSVPDRRIRCSDLEPVLGVGVLQTI